MENKGIYNVKDFNGKIVLIPELNEVYFICLYDFDQYDSIHYQVYAVDYFKDGEFLLSQDDIDGADPILTGLFRWKGCWDHRVYFPDDNEFDIEEVFNFKNILQTIDKPLRIAMKDRTPQWIDDSDVTDPNY